MKVHLIGSLICGLLIAAPTSVFAGSRNFNTSKSNSAGIIIAQTTSNNAGGKKVGAGGAAPRIFDRWGNQTTVRGAGRDNTLPGALTIRKAGKANGMVYIPCSGCDPLSPGRNRRNGGSAERGIYAVHPSR